MEGRLYSERPGHNSGNVEPKKNHSYYMEIKRAATDASGRPRAHHFGVMHHLWAV